MDEEIETKRESHTTSEWQREKVEAGLEAANTLLSSPGDGIYANEISCQV